MPYPKIAAARDPHIPPIDNFSFPLVGSAKLECEDDGDNWRIDLGGELVLDFSHVRLEKMDILALTAKLESSGPRAQSLDLIAQASPVGTKFPPSKRVEIVGPAPFPRSYKSAVEQGTPTVKIAPSDVYLLKPILEPSVFITDLEPPVLPWPLRDEQLEAVYSLLNSTALLLADDPGMGKTVVAIVALTSLFQQGEARRTLVVCPKSGLRHWSGHLQTWAPFLTLTVVHGDQNERALDWRTPAHVYLADYNTLAIDIVGGILSEPNLEFDCIILDGIHAMHFREREISEALDRLTLHRRWALSGSLPGSLEEWISTFSFLTPELMKGDTEDTLPSMRQRFMGNLMHRRKADYVESLPRTMRQEIWLDLQERQMRVYQTAIQEERNRFIKLGGAVTRTHINTAVDRLKRVCNFAPELLDGVKVRALVDLVEEVSAADGKVVVLSHFREDGLEQLRPILEAYGALSVDTDTPKERCKEILEAFRDESQWHVLLMEVGTRLDRKSFKEATYVVHFDHVWNPAVRRRAEQRLYPSLGSMTPINIYEFWVAETIDESLHALLAERGILPGQVSADTQPSELEERLTINDWLQEVFEVAPHVTPAFKIKPRRKVAEEISGTAMLRSHLSVLEPEVLMEEIARVMEALGYPNAKILGEPDYRVGNLVAWNAEDVAFERVYVRCIRAEKNIGVAEGRNVLKDMEAEEDCKIAYLVSTLDFTPACKTLADESDGILVLVSGSELRRHLQILGRF